MWPIKKTSAHGSSFLGWRAESSNAECLKSIYSSNPEELEKLWRSMPADLKNDPHIRSTIALCHLRLASHAPALEIDPESFAVDPSLAISNKWALRITKILLALYLKRLVFLYVPLAVLLNLYFRRFTESQLLLNMYLRVFSDNTAGLRCMTPLFIRCLLKRDGPDRQRYMSFFGYNCALNSVLDYGIELQEREIAKFQRHADQHPGRFWLQEMRLLLGLSRFYNMDYQLADEQFRFVAEVQMTQSFIFVQTLNYASWLRLAVLTMNAKRADEVSSKLQGVFSEEYDKRYALRAHSYRSLIAARKGDKQLSLRELAIANSIAIPGLNRIESCNTECLSHLGVTAKVYLYNCDARHALRVAEQHMTLMKKVNPLSSFTWEANLLVLKIILVIRARNPGGMLDQQMLSLLQRKVAKNLRSVLPLSRKWRGFYQDLSFVVNNLGSMSSAAFDSRIELLSKRYEGQLDEVRACLSPVESDPGFMMGEQFEKTAQTTTQVLRVNYNLVSFISAIKLVPFAKLDSEALATHSAIVFDALIPGCSVSPATNEPLLLGVTLAPGVTERPLPEGFELSITIEGDDRSSPIGLVVRGYNEAFNFRRDLLAALILWKEITEGSIRDKLMVQREVQHEKSKAIVQTVQMLAHDVRKPFSLLRAGISLLQPVNDTTAMRQILDKFVPEVDRALVNVNGLIQDVMDIGADDRANINPQETSIIAMMDRSLAEIFKLHPRSKIDVDFKWDHQTMIHVDPLKIHRVLSNIIGNAVEAMPKTGTMWFKTTQRGKEIEVCIGNAGSYVSEEHIPKLFDAFFTYRKRGGTGLGLAIAKKIVESHGGSIWCASKQDESNPDGQVEFFFTLPASSVVDTHEISFSREYPLEATAGASSQSHGRMVEDREVADLEDELCHKQQLIGRPIRILMVDDEELYRGGLIAFFARSDRLRKAVVIDEASSADEALARVESQSFDIIMTDIDLGSQSADGYSLIKELRLTKAAKAFICVHSNRIVPSDYRTSIFVGAQAFLPKPLSRGQMLRLVLLGISNANSDLGMTLVDRGAHNIGEYSG